MTITPKLGLTELAAAQALPESRVNFNFRWGEFFATGGGVKDRDLAAPPGSPADGDAYLVATGGSGDWSGQDGKIAMYVSTAWEFVPAIEGMQLYVNDENLRIVYDGATWNAASGSGGSGSQSITIALSDLTSDLATGAGKGYWDPPYPITISAVEASVFEAPTGADIEIDVNEEGVSILSTVISIDAGELRSIDSATPPVISDSAITGRLTFDIDQVGSSNAGKGAQVTIEYSAA